MMPEWYGDNTICDIRGRRLQQSMMATNYVFVLPVSLKIVTMQNDFKNGSVLIKSDGEIDENEPVTRVTDVQDLQPQICVSEMVYGWNPTRQMHQFR